MVAALNHLQLRTRRCTSNSLDDVMEVKIETARNIYVNSA